MLIDWFDWSLLKHADPDEYQSLLKFDAAYSDTQKYSARTSVLYDYKTEFGTYNRVGNVTVDSIGKCGRLSQLNWLLVRT